MKKLLVIVMLAMVLASCENHVKPHPLLIIVEAENPATGTQLLDPNLNDQK